MDNKRNKELIERYVDEHMKPKNAAEKDKWIKYFIFILIN